MAVLSRHPPLRSQGARHSHPAGDGGEPLLGAVPAQMAIAVSLEARLSRPANSRTPSPIDEGRGSSGQGTAPCSSAQHTTNESSARHKAVGGGSHLMPSGRSHAEFTIQCHVRSSVFEFTDWRPGRVHIVVQQQGVYPVRHPASCGEREVAPPGHAGAADAPAGRPVSLHGTRIPRCSIDSGQATTPWNESDNSTTYIEDLRRNRTGCHALCPRTTG